MENQYSELLKRQKQEREALLGTRFVDIEKLRLMGTATAELNQVSRHYDARQKELADQHEQEQKGFLKEQEPQKEPEMTEKMARLLEEAKRRREEQQRGRDRDGYDR